jgi:mRNA-degrading endonuclease toxin of MazEF toxin-antitoxin module
MVVVDKTAKRLPADSTVYAEQVAAADPAAEAGDQIEQEVASSEEQHRRHVVAAQE